MKKGAKRTGRVSVKFCGWTLMIVSRHAQRAEWSFAWSVRTAIQAEAMIEGIELPDISHRIPRELYVAAGWQSARSASTRTRVTSHRVQIEYVESWAQRCEEAAAQDGWASVGAWWSMLLARWATRHRLPSDGMPTLPVREQRGGRQPSVSMPKPKPVPRTMPQVVPLSRHASFLAQSWSMSRWPGGRSLIRGSITGWQYVGPVNVKAEVAA